MNTNGTRHGRKSMAALVIAAAAGWGVPTLGNATARDVQSLDGPWGIVIDRENRGVEWQWFKPDVIAPLATREIPVPSCWEEYEEDYEGVVWYTRTVDAPAAWRGRYVRLRFDAVNYRAEVWLNGEVVGRQESGTTPVEFDVTQHLVYGAGNRLVVRVVGPAVLAERVDDYVRNETPHWRGAYLGGIWQSVSLVATDPVFVRDVFVEPDLANESAIVNISVANETFQPVPERGAVEPVPNHVGPPDLPAAIAAREVTVELSVAPAQTPDRVAVKTTVPLTVQPGGASARATLRIPNPALWSPESPNLYTARVRLLAGGREIDSASVRFGLREFAMRDGDFFLNGKKIFIKGAFWEGLYPVTLGHPRDPEIVRKEIRMAKEAGFNLLRPWRMAPAPMILDLADEMGILLTGAPAIECMGYWPSETPRMEEHWTRAFTEMIRRDRNHPSIILWETANEILRKSMLVLRHRVTLAGRALDPTRPILDESGGARAPWGSFVYPAHSSEPVQMDDRHIYRRAPVNESIYNEFRNYGSSRRAVWISEVGYGSFPDIAANVERYRKEGNPKTPDFKYHVELLETLEAVMDRHGLKEIFPDTRSLCLASQVIQALGNKQQLEAIRLNPAADGYCLHAFTDGDWVVGAGVLDLWREPKLLFETLKVVQAPLYPALRVTPSNVLASRGTSLTVTLVNDGPATAGELQLTVMRADGTEAVWSSTAAVKIAEGIGSPMEHPIDTTALRGGYVATARLLRDGVLVAENRFEFMVFLDSDIRADAGDIAVVDVQGGLKSFLSKRGVRGVAVKADADPVGPVVVAPSNPWGPAPGEAWAASLARVADWVRRGGVAVWFQPPSRLDTTALSIYRDWEKNLLMRLQAKARLTPEDAPNFLFESGIFPVSLAHRRAQGNWIPVVHYARPHPVFEALVPGGFMDWTWQNVAARTTLSNLDVPSIAGSVSWESVHDYRAETKAWHGVDLGILPHGEGKFILSTLDVIQNLGKDPLADIVFNRLLTHAREISGPIAPPSPGLAGEIQTKAEAYRRITQEWTNSGS